jgi:protein-disulfide isomerase
VTADKPAAPEGLGPKLASFERKRRVAIVAAIVLVVALVGVGVTWWAATRQKPMGQSQTVPAGALEDGGILVGRDLIPGGEAPGSDQVVTVHIVTDFLCPYCALFEQAHGQALAELAQGGAIRLVIQPINWLGGFNGEYSWRALSAVETVAALEPEHFWAFYKALWENQPAESDETSDLTDEAIAALAEQAGVSQATVESFAEEPAKVWSQWSSDLGRARISGTPSVFLSYGSGTPVRWDGWAYEVVDESGGTGLVAGNLEAALAKVKAGEDPNSE